MNTQNILAIDTATEACSAALRFNGEITCLFDVCPQQHSQRILPMVEKLFSDAAASLDDIDVLAFGHGPGSFTGVRIATGMIQGLSYGSNIPVVGVSTLAAMAQLTEGERIAVAIDARMQEVYYGEYMRQGDVVILQGIESVIPPQEAAKLALKFAPDAIAGTGWDAYPELHNSIAQLTLAGSEKVLYPHAKAMFTLAEQEFAAKGAKTASEITPVYLRDTVTWKKLPGKS